MKITHLFLCTLLFICYSCGNDDTPEPETLTIGLMTATVEGMVVESTLGTANITQLASEGQQFTMTGPTGINPLTAGFLNFNFFLPADEDLAATSYSFADTGDCSVSGAVTEVCATLNVSAMAFELDEGYNSGCTGCSLDVTVTEVDFQNEGLVRGTFTGMVKSISSGDIVPLTAGEFTVKITE